MAHRASVFLLSLSVFLSLSLSGCDRCHRTVIDRAYQLVETHPDSALRLLDSIRSNDLGGEQARYDLVYTIAQDKSGTDVRSDSLIRPAYTYYNSHPDDSLYAKCQYYMGKYYAFNDSSERAVDCLTKAIKASQKAHDPYTQCLALSLCSKTLNVSDPEKAIAYARQGVGVYDKLPRATFVNKVYFLLILAEAYLMADELNLAQENCLKALSLAEEKGDAKLISDACQDLASILIAQKDNSRALKYSIEACKNDTFKDNSKLIDLSWAYLNVDSFKQCEEVMRNIRTKDTEELYTVYYLKHIMSIKRHDERKACAYADSAYSCIENMYGEELNKQERYYSSYAKSQYEVGMTKVKNKMLFVFVAFVVLLAIIITGLIVYSYLQYKDKIRTKIQSQDKERQLEAKLHNEEMRHKDVQLSTMRGYILKKINVAQKLAELREMKEGHVELDDEDWEEIRVFLDSVDSDFVERLQKDFPSLKDEDIRLMMLLRLKMPAKIMAMVYGISEKSIRQKLFVYKSKVGIEDKKLSLREFIEAF
jgi:tetratricopeptide (TPR) repeat protein